MAALIGDYIPMVRTLPLKFSATTYAWFLHDHLGSTVAVYGSSENGEGQLGLEHAYEYRSFGEMAELTSSAGKVTENFTGKERDDETGLSYHEARYLDPMLGVWISVDPKRFFNSPYLYMGNGYNPIRFADLNGEKPGDLFNTPDEAGKDWAVYVNGDSKRMNREAGTYILVNDDGKYHTLKSPLWAGEDGFKIFDLNNIARREEMVDKVVGIAHTHGAEDSKYDSENFSDILNDDGSREGDIPLSQDYGIPIYLMTPSDNFMKYDPSTDEITYPGE